MKDNFEYKGSWFLPSKPENRINGILKYDSKEGATLELFGVLPENGIDIDLINGLTTDSKVISLHRVFLHHRGGMTLVSQGETGTPTSLYTVNYILEGHHFLTVEELQFDSVEAEIFNLDEWVGVSGFGKPDYDPEKIKNHEFSLHYKLPEQIKFNIADGLDGMFNFVGKLPDLVIYMKEATIRQHVELCLNTTAPVPFLQMIDNLFVFQNFITLSIYEATYPEKITLKSKAIVKYMDDDKPILKKINLHFAIRGRKGKEKIKYFPDMLFPYRQIKDDFPRLISTWYSLRYTLEPVYNLLFEQFYNNGPVNENTFLNIAQAAEAMHAKLNSSTKMPAEEYAEMKEEILKATPGKYHTWLNEQFNFGNSLNLHRRLQELVKKYGNPVIDQVIGETDEAKEEFIRKVKHSRNYYTHYSSDGKKNALKSVELFYLSQKLKVIVVSAYLEETGFDHATVVKIMSEHKRYFIPFHL